MPLPSRGGVSTDGYNGSPNNTVLSKDAPKDTASRLLGLENTRTASGHRKSHKPRPKSYAERVVEREQREHADDDQPRDIVSVEDFPELEHLIKVRALSSCFLPNSTKIKTQRTSDLLLVPQLNKTENAQP